MSDDERIEIEDALERHERAITEDAKDIAELKRNIQTLAKEVERLDAAAKKMGVAVSTIPEWADKTNADKQVRPHVKELEKFRKFIADLKTLLFQ